MGYSEDNAEADIARTKDEDFSSLPHRNLRIEEEKDSFEWDVLWIDALFPKKGERR